MIDNIASYIPHLTPEAIRERLGRIKQRAEQGSVANGKAREIASVDFHGTVASLLSGIVVRQLPKSEVVERTAPESIVLQLAEVTGEPYAYFGAPYDDDELLTKYEVFAPIKLKENVEVVRLLMMVDSENNYDIPVDYLGSILSLHYWAARGSLSQNIADAVCEALYRRSSDVLVIEGQADTGAREEGHGWQDYAALALACRYKGKAINVELNASCDFYDRTVEARLAVHAADGKPGPELDLMVPALEFFALLELERGPTEELTAALGEILKTDTKGLIAPSALAERLDLLAYRTSWVPKRIFEDTCDGGALQSVQTVYTDASIVQYIRKNLPVYTMEGSNQLVAIPSESFTDKQALALVALTGARVTDNCLQTGFPAVVLIDVAEYAYTGTY